MIAAPILSLSGSGWLLPFHIGVVDALRARSLMPPRILGASGGALVAAGAVCGVESETLMEGVREAARWTQRHGVVGKCGAPMRGILDAALPPDAHERAEGALEVAVTRAWPSPRMRALRFSSFDSRSDLIDCCYASSFLPLYLEPAATCGWRNERWVDGGVWQLVPKAGPASLSVCPLNLPLLGAEGELITCLDVKLSTLLRVGFLPDVAILDDLYHSGVQAGDAWGKARLEM